MQLLADENFPGDAVYALRDAGHDVVWILTDGRGSDDRTVLQCATDEHRLLVTFDTDFGELAFRAGLPADSGIILFRVPMASPAKVSEIAVEALASRDDWVGHFSVIEVGRIRMTPLPPSHDDADE